MSQINDVDNRIHELSKRQSRVAWENPVTKDIYVSDNDKKPTFPDGNLVLNWENLKIAKQKIQSGKVDGSAAKDLINFGIYNNKDGWQDRAVDYYDNIVKARTAGIMSPDDYTGIEVPTVLATLLGVNERNFSAHEMLTTIPTPYTEVKIDTWTGWDITENLNIGDDVPTNAGTYAQTTITLTMDAAHIAMYDAFDYRPHYHNVWANNLENIGKRFIRSQARKSATLLETASTTSGGANWGAYTTDHSTTSPYHNIGAAADEIVANDGNPSRIGFSDKAYRFMGSNTHATGYGSSTPDSTSMIGAAKIVSGGFLPSGYTAYVDNLFTATVAIVADPEAVVWVQGPRGTAQYRDIPHMANGYIVFNWNKEKLLQSGKVRKLTSITA